MMRSKAMKLSLVVLTLSLSGLFCTSRQNNNSGKNETSGQAPDSADAKFLNTAAEINLLEIKVGQLAQKNGIMIDVKEMGKMLEDDHTKLWNELVDLAKQKQVTIPTTLDKDTQDAYNKLSGAPGEDFDKTFADMMVNGHKEALALFESESKNAKDRDVAFWAESTIPVLQKHLDHALSCQKKF